MSFSLFLLGNSIALSAERQSCSAQYSHLDNPGFKHADRNSAVHQQVTQENTPRYVELPQQEDLFSVDYTKVKNPQKIAERFYELGLVKGADGFWIGSKTHRTEISDLVDQLYSQYKVRLYGDRPTLEEKAKFIRPKKYPHGVVWINNDFLNKPQDAVLRLKAIQQNLKFEQSAKGISLGDGDEIIGSDASRLGRIFKSAQEKQQIKFFSDEEIYLRHSAIGMAYSDGAIKMAPYSFFKDDAVYTSSLIHEITHQTTNKKPNMARDVRLYSERGDIGIRGYEHQKGFDELEARVKELAVYRYERSKNGALSWYAARVEEDIVKNVENIIARDEAILNAAESTLAKNPNAIRLSPISDREPNVRKFSFSIDMGDGKVIAMEGDIERSRWSNPQGLMREIIAQRRRVNAQAQVSLDKHYSVPIFTPVEAPVEASATMSTTAAASRSVPLRWRIGAAATLTGGAAMFPASTVDDLELTLFLSTVSDQQMRSDDEKKKQNSSTAKTPEALPIYRAPSGVPLPPKRLKELKR